MEAFMAFENILMRHREITHGPGAKDFDIGRICNDPYPVRLTVRGLTSDCMCAMGTHCSYCEEENPIWLLIAGTFNPDLHQRKFVFWGYINRDRNGEALRSAADVFEDEQVSCCPNRSQLVFGWYTPYQGKWIRGWIAPMRHSLDELFAMFFNTDALRRTFDLLADPIGSWKDGERRLPPDILWGLVRKNGGLMMRLIRKGQGDNGTAVLKFYGVEYTEMGTCFHFTMTHELSEGIRHTENFDNGRVVVDDEGRWDKLLACRDGREYEFVAAPPR
ncbi:MAG: hypothetical protein Q8P30_02865 [Candidatus Uhrbacteria bacterium]|nr:hypothetical protein [Candidatus Uhrbacteria bacterium]